MVLLAGYRTMILLSNTNSKRICIFIEDQLSCKRFFDNVNSDNDSYE